MLCGLISLSPSLRSRSRSRSRSFTRGAWLLVAALASSATACDQIPARGTLQGWPPGEPVVVGACTFFLKRASLYHSTEWHLDVEVGAANTGVESAYCGFSAQALNQSDVPLTDAAKGGRELPPSEEMVESSIAREANVTGSSSGRAEGAWVYVELSEGHWPVATRSGVIVTPERVRPPS